VYDNHFHDDEIVAIAERDGRIVLTRDRKLLKRHSVSTAAWTAAALQRAMKKAPPGGAYVQDIVDVGCA
jgi:uncharacterized protein with PIN domain